MRNNKVKSILTLLFLFFAFLITQAQKPKSGTYTYRIAFAEWKGKSLGSTCTVIINGDNIKVIHDGKGTLSGKKGDVVDQGTLVKHTKTSQWIIAHKPEDRDAEEVGGCTDGPSVIDFKRKRLWKC